MSAPPNVGDGDAVSIIMLAKVKSPFLIPERDLRKGGALVRVTLAHKWI